MSDSSAIGDYWTNSSVLEFAEGHDPSRRSSTPSSPTPTAYKAAFFDDTTGGSSLHPAGTGCDFVTGLGTPRVNGLAQQWVSRASGGA